MRPSLLCLILVGCGGAAGAPDAAPDGAGGGWIRLVTADWSLGPGSEDWTCTKIVLESDLHVVAIRPVAPLGTHHTLLGLGGGGTAGACTGDLESFVYASGVGTDELRMPEGVGLVLAAGRSLELELHLFNVGDTPIEGTSGIEVLTAPADEIVEEAEVFLPGPLVLDIPPGVVTRSGTCTVGAAQTWFAIFPHMHQLGTHFRSTVTVGGEAIVIHDGPYSFEDQAFIPIEAITLAPGDTITSECTWDNTTGQNVSWGNSSSQEMCFSILYRHPRIPGSVFCVE